MRIAHVSDCYLPRLGGIELQVHDLATRQATAGHEVTILTTTVDRSGQPGDAVRVVRVAGGRGEVEQIRYRRSAAGTDVLAGGAYDVVHAHASSFSPLSFLTAHDAARRGVPTVATVHSLWAKATPLFRAADALTGWADWPVVWSAVSNAAAASLRSILAGRAGVTVVPNGVDPAQWQVSHNPGDPGTLRVAVVSRLASRKRLVQLFDILHDAGRRLPPGAIHVEVFGDGPQRERLEKQLARHGMTRWVHLQGRSSRADIRAAFARSDLFIAPAKLESFGIAALEARCAGLPILARSGTGVADFVVHGREGWLVDSDRDMTDTVVSLVRQPEILNSVASHNRTVPASISWPEVLRRCDTLYRRATILQGRSWGPRRLPDDGDRAASDI